MLLSRTSGSGKGREAKPWGTAKTWEKGFPARVGESGVVRPFGKGQDRALGYKANSKLKRSWREGVREVQGLEVKEVEARGSEVKEVEVPKGILLEEVKKKEGKALSPWKLVVLSLCVWIIQYILSTDTAEEEDTASTGSFIPTAPTADTISTGSFKPTSYHPAPTADTTLKGSFIPTADTTSTSSFTPTADTADTISTGSFIPTATMTTYLTPMAAPGTPGAPHFEGANITEFLERYKDQCTDCGVREEAMVERLPRYCSMLVGECVKAMKEYRERDWEGLRIALLQEYEDTDMHQQMHSRQYLAELKAIKRDGGDVRTYIRRFAAVSGHLVEKEELDRLTQERWFLQGLPRSMAEKVSRRVERAGTKGGDRFDGMVREAVGMIEETKRFKKEMGEGLDQEEYKDLADRFEVKKESHIGMRRFDPPVVPIATVTTAGSASSQEMEELTKAVKELQLNQGLVLRGPPATRGFGQGAGLLGAAGPTRAQVNAAEGQYGQGGGYGNAGGGYGAFGDTPCYYCGKVGHFRSSCAILHRHISEGLCHIDDRGRVYYGKEGEGRGLLPRGYEGRTQEMDVMGYKDHLEGKGAQNISPGGRGK